ncbi:aldo/keto reductase [Actinoplanes teichomyceticus]|uniref:Aryl-alcohol dehydrogenase-like predicted oxidoreductase n=1 Tax=Actinoplanes teichomyceticus TaxID=1867 RepID=A0A561VRY8_ACTTI|nr:aldo/keto reductase [Actinoplanes teichomyceticus]TWG14372.1 aryl-alcohol dehydrogenase-like predicted oxidoreductase [Actinoplanes teichomyceticus]GIF13068.1 aldo/keto reductase [Actinoplanes teichomyceticus]
MQLRNFGRLGRISALTLGGGGIAGVWGSTDRREAVATIHAALDAGITMLDLAPSYGADFEAERAAGEALRSRPGADVMITSKVSLEDDTERDFATRIRRGLTGSLQRIGRDHLDLFLLHTQIRVTGPHPGSIGPDGYREAAAEFERLRTEGLIRAWGITAVGHPDSVLAAIEGTPRPDAAQVVVNPLDLNGDIWFFPGVRPRTDDIVDGANRNGVQVIGIRAVAAGSLTASLDRTVEAGHPAAVDFARAEPFRELAAELGTTPAVLAHRYALTVPGVSTVVLGVKNRTELAECLAAEAAGPLSPGEMAALRELRAAL